MHLDRLRPERVVAEPTFWGIVGGITASVALLTFVLGRYASQRTELRIDVMAWTLLGLAVVFLVVCALYYPNMQRHRALAAAHPSAMLWTISYSRQTVRAFRDAYPDLPLKLPLRGYSLVQTLDGIGLYRGGSKPQRFAHISTDELFGLTAGSIATGADAGSALQLSVLTAEGLTLIQFPVPRDRLGLLRATTDPFTLQGNSGITIEHTEPDIWDKRILIDARIESMPAVSEAKALARFEPDDDEDSGWIVYSVAYDPDHPAREFVSVSYAQLVYAHPYMAVLRGFPQGTVFENRGPGTSGDSGLFHREMGLYIRPAPGDLRPLP